MPAGQGVAASWRTLAALMCHNEPEMLSADWLHNVFVAGRHAAVGVLVGGIARCGWIAAHACVRLNEICVSARK